MDLCPTGWLILRYLKVLALHFKLLELNHIYLVLKMGTKAPIALLLPCVTMLLPELLAVKHSPRPPLLSTSLASWGRQREA